MKSHAISGTKRQTKEFCADGLIRVGYEADAKETGLQTGHYRIQEVFHGVALKAAPTGKRISIGKRLAVKQAGLAAHETPFIGLVEIIPFQYQKIRNNIADLFQIEIIPARGCIFATDFFPKAKQAACAGMQDLGVDQACFFIVVN
jgi:hypothetical protein